VAASRKSGSNWQLAGASFTANSQSGNNWQAGYRVVVHLGPDSTLPRQATRRWRRLPVKLFQRPPLEAGHRTRRIRIGRKLTRDATRLCKQSLPQRIEVAQ
jgi:hypothetical protein